MSSSQTNFQPALLIQANAGTGKTFSLTNRFIWLLNQGESPDKILATTFTKKAAGEISERVFFRLAEAALDEAKSSGLADFLADPQFNSKRASELLTALVESQHRIQISTLDSFFYKLALSFTLELGLIPNWSVIDPELESEYITEAVRKVFQTSDFSLLIKLLKLIGRGKSKKSLTSAIKDLARSGFNLLRETENSGDVWGTIQRPALLETDKIAKSVDQLRKMPIPQTKAGVANKTWSNAVIAALLAIESNSWEDFLEKGIAKYILEGNDKFSRVEIEQNVRAVFQPLIRHATAVLIKVINDQTKSSKHLLELFQAEYLKSQSENGNLSFNDIKHELGSESVWSNLETIYYRLDSQINHLMLDEFQDTSLIEWRVLRPLVDEILSKPSIEKSFFCVGDTKQAIYGWRGGEAQIFNTIPQQWNAVKLDNLSTSFRSSPVISNFVNYLFSEIAANPSLAKYSQAAEIWQTRFSEHKSNAENLPGYVQLELLDTDSKSSDVAYLKILAAKIKQIYQENPGLSLGILTKQNKMIGPLRYVLSLEGITASEEGGVRLVESDAVNAFLSLITLADHPGSSLSRFHVATCPLGDILGFKNYKDLAAAQRLSLAIRKEIHEKGLGFFIQETISKLTTLSLQDELRLSQLVDLAYTFEKLNFKRLRNFTEFISSKKVEDLNPSTVRIMTIHKSKGLEFDIVVMPELDKELGPKGHDGFYKSVDENLENVTQVSTRFKNSIAKLTPELQNLKAQHDANTVLDNLSALYVAVTRSKYALYMYTSKKDKSEYTLASFDGILINSLSSGKADQAGSRYQSGNPDWSKQLPEEELLRPIKPKEYRPVLKSAGSNRDRMLPKKTATNKVFSLKDLLLPSSQSAEFGVAVHALFEKVKWIDDFDVTGFLTTQNLALRTLSAEMLKGYFKKAIENSKISELLSKQRYLSKEAERLKVYTEKPFAFRMKGRIISGIIDRLVVGFNGDKVVFAEIIDFKTSNTENIEIGALVESYRDQMQDYKLAVAREFKLEESLIKAVLAFVGSGEVCEV